MFIEPTRNYNRCYISAPFGSDLGALPMMLGERRVAWNWSEPERPSSIGFATYIQRCDFVIAILNGKSSDYRVLYEVGIAEGLGKPIFVVATNKRVNRFAASKFSVATVGLREDRALAFQLNLFLSTPHESIFERERAWLNCTPFRPDSRHKQKGSSTGLRTGLCLTSIDKLNC